jgi:nitrite reductase/ring-hydroxylating ferredoxin subunit
VKPVTGAERRIVVKSCIHENVCPFLDAALAKGLIEHKPVACKSEARCGT